MACFDGRPYDLDRTKTGGNVIYQRQGYENVTLEDIVKESLCQASLEIEGDEKVKRNLEKLDPAVKLREDIHRGLSEKMTRIKAMEEKRIRGIFDLKKTADKQEGGGETLRQQETDTNVRLIKEADSEINFSLDQNCRRSTRGGKVKVLKFKDEDFPPSHGSLWNMTDDQARKVKVSAYKKELLDRIVWVRPEDVCTSRMKSEKSWKMNGKDIQSTEIFKGKLGGLKFATALALLADREETRHLLFKCVTSQELDKYGVYLARYFHMGTWKTVLVDDLLPCHKMAPGDGEAIYQLIFTSASRKKLCIPLIEKAFAKIAGSYLALQSLETGSLLEMMTGLPTSRYTIPTQTNEVSDSSIVVWCHLEKAIQDDCIILVTPKADMTRFGLSEESVYVICSIKEVEDVRLIAVRSLSDGGQNIWTGPWSPGSREEEGMSTNVKDHIDGSIKVVTKEIVPYGDGVKVRNIQSGGRKEGVFWMRLEEFVFAFQRIESLTPATDCTQSTHTGYFQAREGVTERLVVTAERYCEVNINVYEDRAESRVPSRFDYLRDICVMVLPLGDWTDPPEPKPYDDPIIHPTPQFDGVLACKRVVADQVSLSVCLAPGSYFLLVTSFRYVITPEGASIEGLENKSKYIVQFTSSRTLSVKEHSFDVSCVTDALSCWVMAAGSMSQFPENPGVIWTLEYEEDGCCVVRFVVIGNPDCHETLEVYHDYRYAFNTLSTRGQAGMLYDRIQPGCRKLCLALFRGQRSHKMDIGLCQSIGRLTHDDPIDLQGRSFPKVSCHGRHGEALHAERPLVGGEEECDVEPCEEDGESGWQDVQEEQDSRT